MSEHQLEMDKEDYDNHDFMGGCICGAFYMTAPSKMEIVEEYRKHKNRSNR